jgi:hypothetical protein
MDLPFSESQFLDVFAAFNRDLWPAVIALWVTTLAITIQLWRIRRAGGGVMALLAAHWLWSGVAYHWLYFRAINPAAAVFAVLFVVQGAIFGWVAWSGKGRIAFERSPRGVLGIGLAGYGLVYPFVGLALGLQYPRLPLFAVPCPTTLITAGLLLMSADVPRAVNVVPILWAAIGSSAALVLGIRADLALLVAGSLLALDTIAPRALGRR